MPYYRAELGGNPPYEEGQGLDLTDSTLSLNVASTSEYGGAKVDGETISINAQGQLFAYIDQIITLSSNTSSVNSGSTDTITATASGGGTIFATSNDTDVATVSVSNGEITITGVSAGNTIITVTASSVGQYSPAEAVISVEVIEAVHIYGAEWDGSSNPAWTRTDDAVGFVDPNPSVNGSTGSSPFDNIMPWAGMQIVTYYFGGTLVEIPKFYYKLDQVNGNGLKIQISENQFDGSVCSPAHMDRGDGVGERDYIYVGRYHCSQSIYRSTSGVTPQVNKTRADFRASIHNKGSYVWQMDFATRFTLWLLYIVEFANWNSQTKIGYGCGNNSGVQAMGYTDSMPYHTGTTQASRTTYGLGTQYRYIEGLWDNVYDYLDGCYYNSNGLNIILNPANFSDSSGGISVGRPVGGYPSKFEKKDVSGTFPMFIPTEGSGSDSTYSCDSWSFNASYPCLFAGGVYYRDLNLGLFCVNYTSATLASASRGCRLMVLPPSRLSPPTS